MGGIDLHIHSVASDGKYTVREIVSQAKALGLGGIAITDHDTVRGLSEIQTISCEEDFLIFPGIEISTVWEGQSIHILGYLFDPTQEALLTWLTYRQEERMERVRNILAQLKDRGVVIDEAFLLEYGDVASLGRVHIGRAMIAAGYGYTLDQIFRKWLGEDGPLVIPPHRVTPQDAIEILHQAGGVAVLAHPGLSRCEQWLELFCSWGLDGIEVGHPEHKKKQRKRYAEFVQTHGLFITAGSDFHFGGLGKQVVELASLPERFHSFYSALL